MWLSLEPALLASLTAAAVATLGIFVALTAGGWAEKRQGVVAAFASGALIAAALMHLAPESIEHSHEAPVFMLAGYLALFALGSILDRISAKEVAFLSLAAAPFFGISLHSFIDGVLYATIFEAGLAIGVPAASGLVIHEFAEGVILFLLLRSAGSGAGAAFLFALLGAAVTTPIGAYLSLAHLQALDGEHLGNAFGLAAGALIYISAAHLSAHIRKSGLASALPAFLLGAVIVAGAAALTHA